MEQANGFLNRYVVPPLTALSENTYMSAIRAGMVSIVPLTIIGGVFMIVAYLPIPERWSELFAFPAGKASSPPIYRCFRCQSPRPLDSSPCSCALPSVTTWGNG